MVDEHESTSGSTPAPRRRNRRAASRPAGPPETHPDAEVAPQEDAAEVVVEQPADVEVEVVVEEPAEVEPEVVVEPESEEDAGPAALADLISNIMPYAALTSTLGGAAGLAVGALIVKKSLSDPTAYGDAWLKGSLKKCLVSFCLGAVVGLLYLLIPLFILTPSEGTESGLFSQMALHPGLGRFVWIIIAILLAPFIEELLFRGIMLGGISRSFGIFGAWSYPICCLSALTPWKRCTIGRRLSESGFWP